MVYEPFMQFVHRTLAGTGFRVLTISFMSVSFKLMVPERASIFLRVPVRHLVDPSLRQATFRRVV